MGWSRDKNAWETTAGVPVCMGIGLGGTQRVRDIHLQELVRSAERSDLGYERQSSTRNKSRALGLSLQTPVVSLALG